MGWWIMEPELVKQTLLNPSTYGETECLQYIQTATSMVFLTGKYAYKTNRNVKFSFLDYSTKEKRMEAIQREFEMNQQMTPELYEELLQLINGKLSPARLTTHEKPDALVIKMKQADHLSSMDNALKTGIITVYHIKELAQVIAKFHQHAEIENEYGTVDKILFGWEELLAHVACGREGFISASEFELVKGKVLWFIEKNNLLFSKRVADNKIRFCHGDLHSGNVFLSPKVMLFDRITFNKRFPCCDVISDLAFMIMDLEFHQRSELAKLLVDEYILHTSDHEGLPLLRFYTCFRAWIRGCINYFEKNPVSKKYFDLAVEYARQF